MKFYLVIWLATSWKCPAFSGWVLPAALKPFACQEQRRLEWKITEDPKDLERVIKEAGRPVEVLAWDGSAFKSRKVTETVQVSIEP